MTSKLDVMLLILIDSLVTFALVSLVTWRRRHGLLQWDVPVIPLIMAGSLGNYWFVYRRQVRLRREAAVSLLKRP